MTIVGSWPFTTPHSLIHSFIEPPFNKLPFDKLRDRNRNRCESECESEGRKEGRKK
jgi:hypothetical protein